MEPQASLLIEELSSKLQEILYKNTNNVIPSLEVPTKFSLKVFLRNKDIEPDKLPSETMSKLQVFVDNYEKELLAAQTFFLNTCDYQMDLLLKAAELLFPFVKEDVLLTRLSVIQITAISTYRNLDSKLRADLTEYMEAHPELFSNSVQASKKRRNNHEEITTAIMEAWYKDHIDNPYPNEEQKYFLAKLCGIDVKQVAVWFYNAHTRKYGKKNDKPSKDVPK